MNAASIERYVVSFDLSHDLKAAGYPQDYGYYWYFSERLQQWKVSNGRGFYNPADDPEDAHAPMTDQLLEALRPHHIAVGYVHGMFGDELDTGYYQTENWDTKEQDWHYSGPTAADALAKLWLWCKKKGYIQ